VRTQQIAALETGVTEHDRPFGRLVLSSRPLPDELEKRPTTTSSRSTMGGVRAIENGFQMREIAEASARYQREMEDGTRKIVNVNIEPGRRVRRWRPPHR